MPTSTRPARTGSVRVAAWQRQRLGDADRRRIMDAARRLERRTHQPGMHGGHLRRTGILVLWALLYRGPSRHGVCDPSIGQLAAWSGCARSTVQLALLRIEEAGIMGHVRRGVVAAGRWVQWTNAYLFASPDRWAGSDTESRSAKVSKIKNHHECPQGARPQTTLAEQDQIVLAAKWGLDISREGIR